METWEVAVESVAKVDLLSFLLISYRRNETDRSGASIKRNTNRYHNIRVFVEGVETLA